ncbi:MULTISPECIES: metallophosphoesterase [unclassified Paenibacillus]|uniref:metallophosphoesterase n=1 Tax=unclassified Paenibacillus TaxID=185978 RepID=UPI00070E5F6F|nr:MULTISPECIES: metallophosphoesterase [unclassified Paenibacillus]KQX62638.1 metallophosphoesterase [Paenibacillus sp. Root444D2]KRE46347.1 metallophosphoesterase [Paenibacillus sp. Soil724D2]
MLTIVKGPYLQCPTENSITIMWETSEPASSTVNVLMAERIHSGYQGNYKKPEHVLVTVDENEYSTIHRLTVNHLEPNTLYFYQVRSVNERGEIESGYHFLKTAVRRGESFSFTVTSETGGYSGFDKSEGQINRNIFSQMQRYRPDITLFVGDIVNDGNNYEDWEKYFFGPGKEFLTNTPFYSCLGNHEDNASWYYDFFAYNSPKNYYSFDYGDTHFICLDSTDFIERETYPNSSGKMVPGNEQFDFFIRDLQSTSAKWKIVYFHYPPFVSGGYQVEDLQELCPLMEQYGVDLVINSHTIVYERSHPICNGKVDFEKGIVYIVAGGAGAMPDWFLPKRSWHTAQSLAVPHFLNIVMTTNSLELQAIDEHGSLFDKYCLYKESTGKRIYL